MNPDQNPTQPQPTPPQNPAVPPTQPPQPAPSAIDSIGNMQVGGEVKKFTQLVKARPKLMFIIAALTLLIVAAVVLVNGGPWTGIFSKSLSYREVRSLVYEKAHDGTYGFSIRRETDVDCSGIEAVRGATTTCTIQAWKSIGDTIEGPVTATVRLQTVSPTTVELENIKSAGGN